MCLETEMKEDKFLHMSRNSHLSLLIFGPRLSLSQETSLLSFVWRVSQLLVRSIATTSAVQIVSYPLAASSHPRLWVEPLDSK